MRRTMPVLFLLAILLPATATAQIDTRGKKSLSVSAFGTIQEGSTLGSVSGGLTAFLTEAIELGGDVQLTISSFSDGFGTTTTNTQGFMNARGRYNLVGQSMTVPFVSLGVGKNVGGTSTTVLSAGGGIKRFINERVSFNGEGIYQNLSVSTDFGDSSSSSILLLVGISIYTD